MVLLRMLMVLGARVLLPRVMSLKLGWNRVDACSSRQVNIQHLKEVGVVSKNVAPPECGIGRFEMSQGPPKLGQKHSVVDGCFAIATEEFVGRAGQIALEILARKGSVRSLHCESFLHTNSMQPRQKKATPGCIDGHCSSYLQASIYPPPTAPPPLPH